MSAPAVLGCLWLSGSVAWLGLAAIRTIRFRRFLVSARPVPDETLALVRGLSGRMGLKRIPRVVLTHGTVSPVVWGLFGPPRILLPENLWSALGEEERTTLLAHEIAHLRRRDHWVRLLEVAATSLYWWHPVVWWAKREIARAEEDCCDAWVLWVLPGSSGAYGRALLATVEFLSGDCGVPVHALGSRMSGARALRRRIEMIMQGGRPRALTKFGGATVIVAAACFLPFLPGLSTAQEKPAGGKAAPGPEPGPEVRHRLEAVEGKLDRILKELEAMRTAQGQDTGEVKYGGKPLGQWIRELGDRDREVSKKAIEALVQLRDEALPQLLSALKSGDWLVRANGLEALWSMQVDVGIRLETILSMLGDPEKRVRDAAAGSFQQIKLQIPCPEAIPHLSTALKAELPQVRGAAAEKFGYLAHHSDAAENAFREVLRQAVPALITGLRDPEPLVRLYVALNLREFGPLATAAIPALAESLKDTPEIRRTAAVSAAAIGPGERTGEFLQVLIEMLKGGLEREKNREWADSLSAAMAIAKLGPAAREAVPVLSEMLKDLLDHPEKGPRMSQGVEVRAPEFLYALAVALARLVADGVPAAEVPMPRVIELLSEAIWSLDASVRLEAMKALAALGPAARDAIPRLEEALSKPPDSRPIPRRASPRMVWGDQERAAAEEALKRIRGN